MFSNRFSRSPGRLSKFMPRKSHSKLIFQKLNLNLELGKVQCSSSKNWSPVQANFVVKIKRVPKRLSSMAQTSAWSMTGMSTLLGRDTTAGLLACKRRRLESEQQSAADLSRRCNLCAVLAVVIHDLEAGRGEIVWTGTSISGK